MSLISNDKKNNKNYEMIILNVSEWKNNYLNSHSVRCKDRFKNINHPLVTAKKAFWIDNNNLCIGYKLKKKKD
jgi:hypothetical protein